MSARALSLRTWSLYGVLLVIAVALAIAAGSNGGKSPSSSPSVTSHGGGGLAAIYEYLGDRADSETEPLTSLSKTTHTLVIAAPTARLISAEEVTALDHWIRAGGTLVYLAPREKGSQPELSGWLGLADADRLGIAKTEDDPGGSTARVWAAQGPFTGLRELRVAAARGIRSELGWLLPVAGTDQAPVMLWGQLGRGQVVVAAGTDVAENRRIELLDNRRLWENLAADAPIAFDEFHQTAPEGPPMSFGVLAFVGQALFALAFLTFARGTRLGPPAPEARDRQRPGIEYAKSFAALVRSAHVERELVIDLEKRLKRIAHDRLGVSLSLPDAELAREVERRIDSPGEWSALSQRIRDAAAMKQV
ncbi:MAG: DUF4350 domain-containing protein, partial [Myxococcaceae bacterium]